MSCEGRLRSHGSRLVSVCEARPADWRWWEPPASWAVVADWVWRWWEPPSTDNALGLWGCGEREWWGGDGAGGCNMVRKQGGPLLSMLALVGVIHKGWL